MAKRAARRNTTASSRRIESKVVDYAEELGRLLGTVRARVDNIVVERGKLVEQLAGVVKEAQGLLSELGHEAATRVGRLTAAARGRKPKTAKIPKRTAGGPDSKKHRLPATTRQKMAKRRSTSAGAAGGGGAEGSEM
jgi:hypothetical protein